MEREEVQDDEKETLKMNQRFLNHIEDSARLQENPPTNKRDDSTKRTFYVENRETLPLFWRFLCTESSLLP